MNGIRRSLLFVVVLSLAVLFSGCTVIPTEAFEAYKKAFDDVRLSGEEVLLDYDVAKSDYEERKAAVAEDEQSDAGERFVFDFSAINDIKEPLDDFGARMQAWEVLGRYNEALTAAAAGRSAEEISAAVDGLTESLSRFSVEAISEAAAEVTPFAGIAKVALEIIEREIAARRFVKSIQTVHPEINRFLDLLEKDAGNFYNIRLGLHNLDYDKIVDGIYDESERFQDLMDSLEVPAEGDEDKAAELHSLVKEINDVLAAMPEGLSDNILVVSQSGDGPYTELAHSEFVGLKTQIKRLAAEAKALDDELIAYREVLIGYVKLIQQTRLALSSVMTGIEEGRRGEVVAQNLFEAALKLRRAIAEYKNKKVR